MTGGELSAERRAAMRADTERHPQRVAPYCESCRQNVLALLDAVDAAEARVAAMEAERDKAEIRAAQEANDAHEWGIQNDALKAEVARLTAERHDLRSRLACVLEASYWDQGYDVRISHIRGMCDLSTNGLTATDDGERTAADLLAENRRLTALVEAAR